MDWTDKVEVYFGYFNNIIYIISESKDVVITYFEQLRGLSKTQYEIKKKRILESELSTSFEDEYASEWNGFYIPNIDIIIINMMEKPLIEEIETIIDILKMIIVSAQDIKKIKREEIITLVNSIKILQRFSSTPKIMNKLEENNTMQNSILFSSMKKYIESLSRFKNIRDERNNGFNTWYEWKIDE